MPNYLCLQRSLPVENDNERPSPSQMQEMYAQFTQWKTQFEVNIVDMGGKLGDGRLVKPDVVTDGLFLKPKNSSEAT